MHSLYTGRQIVTLARQTERNFRKLLESVRRADGILDFGLIGNVVASDGPSLSARFKVRFSPF
jgi:hypothetical protein